MRTSTKQSILSYLEGLDWTPGSAIEDQATYWFTKASTVSRRVRELHEDGQLDRKLVKGCVWYKKRPTKQPIEYQKIYIQYPQELNNQLFETPPPRFNANPRVK